MNLIKTKFFFSFVFVLAMSSVAFGNDLNGTFICDVTMISDGSSGEDVLVIKGNTLKSKPLGFDDVWYNDYTLIHTGKVNPFKTFVLIGNQTEEHIITIRVTGRKNTYHFNKISTSKGWKPNERFSHGICKKI